jgi:nucleoside-diphosphate-sugar epimerase
MHNLIVAGLDGTRARIPATETMANEYVYARDVGRAVDLAATVPMPEQIVFNIGNGVVTRFEELLAAVKALCPGLSYEVEPGDAPDSKLARLDISAAKRDLGWEPRFTIASAFADYLAELKAARAQAP